MLGVAFNGVRGVLYPAVALSDSAVIQVNFGQDPSKPFSYTPTAPPKPTEGPEHIEHPRPAEGPESIKPPESLQVVEVKG